jgi:hypothetical protein
MYIVKNYLTKLMAFCSFNDDMKKLRIKHFFILKNTRSFGPRKVLKGLDYLKSLILPRVLIFAITL